MGGGANAAPALQYCHVPSKRKIAMRIIGVPAAGSSKARSESSTPRWRNRMSATADHASKAAWNASRRLVNGRGALRLPTAGSG